MALTSDMQLWILSISALVCLTSGNTPKVDLHKLHTYMTEEELGHHFGVDQHHLVDHNSYQVVPVHHELHDDSDVVHDATMRMSAFGREYQAKMIRNKDLLHDSAEIWIAEAENDSVRLDYKQRYQESAHFVMLEPEMVGGISFMGGRYHGFLRDEDNRIFDIMPLRPRLHDMVHSGDEQAHFHLVKLVKNQTSQSDKENEPIDEEYLTNPNLKIHWGNFVNKDNKRSYAGGSSLTKRASPRPLTIETAVFMDCTSYSTFEKFFKGNSHDLVDFILSLVNGIQGVYNFPSLGRKVTFPIVFIEIHKTCRFDDKDGERSAMLTSFCSYQKGKLQEREKPWDEALLLSGTDMWGYISEHSAKKSYSTLGLATVSGICYEDYNCVMGEIGVRDKQGKSYPSTGYLAVYIMAHEVGHNLGMYHDGSEDNCPVNGHVMSATRGTAGECTWSSCSRAFVQELEMECLDDGPNGEAASHDKFEDMPGRLVHAAQQCKLLMSDDSAAVQLVGGERLENICDSMLCRSPKNGFSYSAGPALPGTRCGPNRECYEGRCVSRRTRGILDDNTEPHWLPWGDPSPCQTNCIKKSIGVSEQTRECKTNDVGCPGLARRVQVCDNPQVDPECGGKKFEDPDSFASDMCQAFKKASEPMSKMLTGEGKQVDYNVMFPERACLIHCKTSDGSLYTPLSEESGLKIENPKLRATFPDGTICSKENQMFCLDGTCQKPTSRSSRVVSNVNQNLPVINIADGDGKPKDNIDPFFLTNADGTPLRPEPEPSKENVQNLDVFETDGLE